MRAKTAAFAEVDYTSLPFQEAIRFFRRKLSMPTNTWTDLWKEQHTAAFTVAGAVQTELLQDLRDAVDDAIVKGVSLGEFRNTFDDILAKSGWQPRGGRDFRARVIYDTNVRTAYQAGRYKQMMDPDVLFRRPFWEYRHSGKTSHARPLHKSWNGLVLPADDPFWATHYPPNGFHCGCTMRARSPHDLQRMGKTVDTAPDDGTYEWVDKKTGEVHTIPNGIDPGWDYNVGKGRPS